MAMQAAIKMTPGTKIHGLRQPRSQDETRWTEARPMLKALGMSERRCLHCLIVEVIDDYFEEFPPKPGGSDKIDTEEADEVIEALAKTVAELTSGQDSIFRQHLIERLMREIMKFDDEFRREEGGGAMGSHARH